MKGVLIFPVVVFCFFYSAYTATTSTDYVYFSSLQTIQVFFNNTTAVVFNENPYYTGKVSCDPVSGMIYWVDLQGFGNAALIRRGSPDDPQSIETIVSHDLTEPYDIAVDWAGSNIYFSQYLGAPSLGSRIEVISADGRHRKVLFDGIYGRSVPLAIDIIRGHLFFEEDYNKIYRTDLDGSNKILILELFYGEIEALSVDVVENVLYWVQYSVMIHAFPLEQFTGQAVFFDDLAANQPFITTILRDSAGIHDVFVFDGTIYWTQTRSSEGVLRNGSLLGSTVGPSQPLLSGRSISPEGVCTFIDTSILNPALSSPCFNSTICGDAICYTIPGVNGSTTHRCGCSTGLLFNEESRSCTSIPENFLIFTIPHYNHLLVPDSSEIRLIPIPDDENLPFVDLLLPIEVDGADALFVGYDFRAYKVYWTEQNPPSIKRADLNGGNQEVLINTSISFPGELAIDPFYGNIYWADSNLGIISVASLSNPHVNRRVLFSSAKMPQGLAIDIARGLVYWTDIHETRHAVEKGFMNGHGRQLIEDDIYLPTSIAIDSATGDVYWASRGRDYWYTIIKRYTLDGQKTILPVSRSLLDVIGLTVSRDYLYFVDRASSRHSIGRIDKVRGGNVHSVHDGRLGLSGLVAVDTTASYNNASEVCVSLHGNCSSLCLPSGTRSESTCACPDHMRLDEDEVSCIDPTPIFIISSTTSTTTSLRVVEDSTIGNNSLLSARRISLSIPPRVQVGAMDVDSRGNSCYFINTVKKVILRVDLNSSTENITTTIISCCLDSPEDLAVDWLGRNLYWTDSQRRVIEVSFLSGEGRRVLTEVNSTLGPPGKLALDPFGGFIYWSSKSEPKIYATRMDGSQQHRHWLIAEYPNTPPATIFAISLSFSEWTTRVYWGIRINSAKDEPVEHKVIRSEVPTIIPYHGRVGPDREIYIRKLDVYDLQVSFIGDDADLIVVNEQASSGHTDRVLRQINGNRLGQSSGSNVFNSSAMPSLQNFVVSHHSIQPGRHVCEVHRCTGDELCLVKNETHGSCVCPTHYDRWSFPPCLTDSATLLDYPLDTIADVYDSVSFTCTAGGLPLPSISWFKDGSPLDLISANITNFTTSTYSVTSVLQLELVFPEDAGNYSCNASHPVSGSDLRSFTFNVEGETCSYTFFIREPPPEITCNPWSPTSSLVLQCQVSAISAPFSPVTLRWLFNGAEITQFNPPVQTIMTTSSSDRSGRMRITSTMVFEMDADDLAFSGDYVCQVDDTTKVSSSVLHLFSESMYANNGPCNQSTVLFRTVNRCIIPSVPLPTTTAPSDEVTIEKNDNRLHTIIQGISISVVLILLIVAIILIVSCVIFTKRRKGALSFRYQVDCELDKL